MIKTPVKYLLLLLAIGVTFLSQCKNIKSKNEEKGTNKIAIKDSIVIYKGGRFIFDDKCDSNGKITGSGDTVDSKIKVRYYSNGNIHEWEEFVHSDEYPNFVAYYDSSGALDTFMGNPFIRYGHTYTVDDGKKLVAIATVNLPNVDYCIIVIDSNTRKPNAKILALKYEVSFRDTCGLFLVENELISEKDRYIKVRFYIVDSVSRTCRRATKELSIQRNGDLFTFDSIPYRAYSFEEWNAFFN